MKKVHIVLSLLATTLLGSSLTNSAEEKPTGGVTLGEPSQQFSEFRADFEESRRWKEESCRASSLDTSSPMSASSSVPSGRSEFYQEVLRVGTRHQYAKSISEQDELERALEESRREAEFNEQERKALEASENLILEELHQKEIARLEDQIETLEAFQVSMGKDQSAMSDSLMLVIDKKYAYGATDTDESRAEAVVEYDRLDNELSASRAQNQLIRDELSDLRYKHGELKYGNSIRIPSVSSGHLSSGIGGPTGSEGGLPLIHSSAIPVLSVVPTDTAVDKL